MEITVAGGGIMAQTADTYVVEVFEDGRLASEAAALDAAMGGAITQLIEDGFLTGRPGEISTLISKAFFDIVRGSAPEHAEWRHAYVCPR